MQKEIDLLTIKNVEFIKSFSKAEDYKLEKPAPEFCFAGRSNVGKSSLINMLCGRKISFTSSLPGRTRLINVFSINNGQFNFVDVPGYGYAAAAKSSMESWQSLIEGYFSASNQLKLLFLLVDNRVLSPLDHQMLVYLNYYQIPFVMIATKCDKVKVGELRKNLSSLSTFFSLGRDDIIAASSNGMGKEKILNTIASMLER
jgi:GTP-binding protein